MRIIAGRFRGQQLVNFKASHIRPTTDRVKESIFNKIMGHLSEARVLDLYSGTGNLSFEALSRGAAHIECVESNRKSVNIINQNVEKLKIADEIVVHSVDVFKFLKSYAGEGFDLVFIDPPFTKKLAHDSMLAIADSCAVKGTGIVVIEASSHETIEDDYNGFKLLDRKQFGDKSVSFFEREE